MDAHTRAFFANHCQRCGDDDPTYTIMSRFNTQIICGDCEKAERAHPKYAEAAEAELAAVRRGERNFPGIGLPADLMRRRP